MSVRYDPVIENNKKQSRFSTPYVKASIHSEAAPEQPGPALGPDI
jgi:hypothetical protein